jgi:hypothetical protein
MDAIVSVGAGPEVPISPPAAAQHARSSFVEFYGLLRVLQLPLFLIVSPTWPSKTDGGG